MNVDNTTIIIDSRDGNKEVRVFKDLVAQVKINDTECVGLCAIVIDSKTQVICNIYKQGENRWWVLKTCVAILRKQFKTIDDVLVEIKNNKNFAQDLTIDLINNRWELGVSYLLDH